MNLWPALILIADIGVGDPSLSSGAAITIKGKIPGYIVGISTLDSTLLPCRDGRRPTLITVEDKGFALYCGAFGAVQTVRPFMWPDPTWPPVCPIDAHWTTVPGGWQVVIQCEGTPVS